MRVRCEIPIVLRLCTVPFAIRFMSLSIRLCSWRFLTPANEVWGKVIFSQACVSHSVHCDTGGSLSGDLYPGVSVQEGGLGQGGYMQGDPPESKKRAVRILLECLLVELKNLWLSVLD